MDDFQLPTAEEVAAMRAGVERAVRAARERERARWGSELERSLRALYVEEADGRE